MEPSSYVNIETEGEQEKQATEKATTWISGWLDCGSLLEQRPIHSNTGENVRVSFVSSRDRRQGRDRDASSCRRRASLCVTPTTTTRTGTAARPTCQQWKVEELSRNKHPRNWGCVQTSPSKSRRPQWDLHCSELHYDSRLAACVCLPSGSNCSFASRRAFVLLPHTATGLRSQKCKKNILCSATFNPSAQHHWRRRGVLRTRTRQTHSSLCSQIRHPANETKLQQIQRASAEGKEKE